MSVKVMTWVWDHSQTIGNERLVLLAIADQAGDDGRNSWPPISRLAQKTRLSPSTIRRCIASMEARGEIAVDKNAGGDSETRGDRRPNRYTVFMDDAITGCQSDTPYESTGCQNEGNGVSLLTPVTSFTSLTKKPDPRSGPFWDEFQQVWEVYPRRTAKLKSFEAFQARRRCGVSFQDLFDATKRYRDEVAGTEERFIKHGSTFFGPGEFWREQLESESVVRDKLNGWVER